MVDWMKEVQARETELICDTQAFLQIKSVLDESTASEKAPFGRGIRKAYDWLLQKAEKDGFVIKDLDGYAGHIEWGEGRDIVGVLCHLDVVPEGDGWTSDPYAAEIRDGKIVARGAIDDKGPTMAAYYALKIVRDTGLVPNKRVRLIIGTDEESEWRCMKHYFQHEEMPASGFAPDADFPVIYAEKGICDIEFSMSTKGEEGNILSFVSGERLNMVPQTATAVVRLKALPQEEQRFAAFLAENNVKGDFRLDGDGIQLTVYGKSAHGMEPEKGVNSGLILAHYIHTRLELNDKERAYFSALSDLFYNDSRGTELGVDYQDREKGDVTLNVGVLRYAGKTGGTVGVNVRYPDGASFTSIYKALEEKMGQRSFAAAMITHETPHAVDKEHGLIQTLAKVYEEQTGEKAEPFAIGGGTYARSLKAGVAFGPLFPGQEDVAHQADEYISIEQLKKATAIYAQAVYELIK